MNLLDLLRRALINPAATFHPGPEEAINAVLEPPFRALVVQATGWGKSMVYFIATRVLRDAGKGPTLVVSPLLSLMRNQIDAARNLGLRASSIASDGSDEELRQVEADLKAGTLDLLLVSPERLANEDFQTLIASSSLSRVGLVVIDEAHCISDWGHDFRPDYKRLSRLARSLPPTTSVLATTATANDRVVEDIVEQLGNEIEQIRGSLARDSLRIQVIIGYSNSERYAWISDHLADFEGSGIIYTLTTRDADRLAEWLKLRGHNVEAYHAKIGVDAAERRTRRATLESRLLQGDVKALVATVALGMGFDKPDIGFVIHYQSPGNLVAYYQQIGRAGRAIQEAYAILFLGSEDDEIHEFFIQRSGPQADEIDSILNVLEGSEDGMSVPKIMEVIDLQKGSVDKVLKVLSALTPSPVVKVGSKWRRTPDRYVHDHERDEALRGRREAERTRFLQFAASDGCYMALVRSELNDKDSEACGRCSNCLETSLIEPTFEDATLLAAQRFLAQSEFEIEPRRRWEGQALSSYGFVGKIDVGLRCDKGLCLSTFREPGIGTWVAEDKLAGRFRDELVNATAEALERKGIDVRVDWVTAVPSLRSDAVSEFAERLAKRLGKPFQADVKKVKDTPPQKKQQNSFHQSANLNGAFEAATVQAKSVLLVDDMVDSKWTFTVVGALLRRAGASNVIPLALTSTSGGGDDETT